MLKIYETLTEEQNSNLFHSCDALFNVVYEKEWLDDPAIIKIIKDVDKSTVLNNGVLESDFLGMFPPEKLSGGCKSLILMTKYDEPIIFSSAIFGNNCLNHIFELAKRKDISIYLCSYLFLGENDDRDMFIDAQNMHLDKHLKTYRNYFDYVLNVASRRWC